MSTSRTCRQTPVQPKTRRLGLENLEERRVMATTVLALDFTPDYRQGSLADTFSRTRYSNGTAPAFLDFNGDRRITSQDVDLAAASITNVVRSYFANAARGFNVSVVFNDATTQTSFGARYLDWGRSSTANQVAVIYVGGSNVGELGRAPLAPEGYNVEGFGQAYSQTGANMLMSRSGMTKDHFAWFMGGAIAHEFGHMLGLRHSLNYGGDLMNPNLSNSPWADAFSTQNRYTEGGGPQNATNELRNSFYGQGVQYTSYNGGSYLMPPTGESYHHDHGHEAAHDHALEQACEFDVDQLLAGFDPAFFKSEVPSTDTRPIGGADLTIAAAAERVVTTGQSDLSLQKGVADRSNSRQEDLVSLLAGDLPGSRQASPSQPPAKSAAKTVALDALFADYGLVQAK